MVKRRAKKVSSYLQEAGLFKKQSAPCLSEQVGEHQLAKQMFSRVGQRGAHITATCAAGVT